ncbi:MULTISPECIES: peptidylprolyl isomerase [unclassified Rickettsia]|uniref:peptidylprolyl isomerase n=1 Tax=unclassified Rickettsia TaxID=114295 RepID=UPI00209E829D|nr:peptidylprolyl isomerase [Rickettsia endosymbiont of Ceutorhynchus assimilis]
MKKLSVIFLSISMLSSVAFADDKVIATYKGGEVRESQIMKELAPQLSMQPELKDKTFADFAPEQQEQLIKIFVNNILLKQEAEKSGIESSKEFQEKLDNAKNQLAQQELLSNYVKSHITDKMIDEEYNKYAASLKGKEEIKVAHILVKTQKEANEIKTKLSKGQNFAKLAQTYSTDTSTKANGGDIGYIILNQQGQLVPEFEKKAFALKVNEVSAPIKTDFGWHVITVLEKRPVRVPTIEEAKTMINNKLAGDVLKQYIAELESKADVKIMLPKKAEATDADSKK